VPCAQEGARLMACAREALFLRKFSGTVACHCHIRSSLTETCIDACGPKRQVIMVTNGSAGCVFMIVISSNQAMATKRSLVSGEPEVKPVAA
jgi:hypothetical protein